MFSFNRGFERPVKDVKSRTQSQRGFGDFMSYLQVYSPGNTRGAIVDREGNLYYSNTTSGLVKISKAGKIVWTNSNLLAYTYNYSQPFCIDNDNNLLMCFESSGNYGIKKINPITGEVIWTSTIFNSYGNPTCITTDDSNNIYTGMINGYIYRFRPSDGAYVNQVSLYSGVCYDINWFGGRVYFSNYGNNDSYWRFFSTPDDLASPYVYRIWSSTNLNCNFFDVKSDTDILFGVTNYVYRVAHNGTGTYVPIQQTMVSQGSYYTTLPFRTAKGEFYVGPNGTLKLNGDGTYAIVPNLGGIVHKVSVVNNRFAIITAGQYPSSPQIIIACDANL